ncbi:DNA repair exonuclease SbcCD ATPase subunit [Paenibacillus sp. UNCCL117]|uniref:hypothetical protein n=1 Tax=unclassified Paenibacillus TaxID=185978 RepID=UPI00088F5156|nr:MULTISPECIES: hypothetical protein [unclassified Paenibacillus]SDE47304.1 DNA repair exonuclease SbcCD ATPase subunit [Paenibacillus sp. cl123]SFW65720.1 DNA repair exonuclease SbcCD ATPase subunit [Paenibacillus sp. UNCCL117]
MPNWIEAIRSCGLTFIKKHTFGESLELYETLHSWQGIKLGKYLIIPASGEQLAAIAESSDQFRRFEEEVISPFYFRLKGDWSWNLYIVFAVTDMAGLTAEKLSLIQRGKRYGKKLVIPEGQLASHLPAAKIPGGLGGTAAGHPLLDWQRQLAAEGLLFCLDNFRSQPVKHYVSTAAEPEPLPPEPAAAEQVPVPRPVGPIASLEFGSQFRPHVLADVPPLSFARVNLLAGPNGMGKTSVLESIELAFTGSIQRNVLAGERQQAAESWDGRITFQKDGEAPFHGLPHNEEKKERETTYYKHRVGPRANSQLNSAFHQYNYFSSEAVHQFCFGQAGKVDYRAAFARVIFGEQLERYEQCWKQHLEEFQRLGRKLEEERGELETRLSQVYAEGAQDSELLKSRAQAQLQQLGRWMQLSLFSYYPMPEKTASLPDIGEWLQHLTPRLHELDVAAAPLPSASLPDIGSIDDLQRQEAAVRAALDGLQARIAERRRELEQLPDSAGLEQRVQQLEGAFARLRQEQELFERLVLRLTELARLLDHRDSRHIRLQLDERLRTLESSIRSLEDIDNLYGQLAEQPVAEDMEDRAATQARLDELESRRAQAQETLRLATAQAEQLKEKTGRLQKLLSELKSTARMALHLHPDQSHCPLCGHDHETTQLLRAAIDSSLQADDAELTRVLDEVERSRLALEDTEAGILQLRHELARLSRLDEARAYLLSRRDVEETEALASESEGGHQAVQRVLTLIRERLGHQAQLREDLRLHARALDERGVTASAVRELNTLLADALLAPYLGDDREALSAAQLLIALQRASERVSADTEAARRDYAAAQEGARQAEAARQAAAAELSGLHEQARQLELRLQAMDELRQACSRLEALHVSLPGSQPWSEWKLYFQKLLLAAKELEQTLEPLVLIERTAREAAGLMNRLTEKTVMRDRCARAVQTLAGLRSLSDYGDDFVRSNFEAISRLFVALHSPSEFEGLEWTADRRIEARRKGTGTRCAIYQMSTGQRTSVLLAIFFIMHLVMDSAPQFLLLDEPVAHLDELNVLGLLDFLRQLTITRGTQLFFTTANPQIATLFRRKFSFLEDNFRVFHLRRDTEGPLRIHIQQFKPYQEKAIAVNQ